MGGVMSGARRLVPPVREYLVATLGFAVALLVAPASGGLLTGLPPVFATIVISGLAIAYGRALAPSLTPLSDMPKGLVWIVVGYAAASAVHLGATALLDVGARGALAVDVAGAFAVTLLVRRARPEDGEDVAESCNLSLGASIAAAIACACLAAFWARETIGSVPGAAATGIFPAWQDYFLHAAEISYLRDYPSFERHSQYLTAIPQPLYHRGSYALAALFSELARVPSLSTATVYWLPTGLLLCMCATFALGASLGGPIAGAGAITAVFLLPDASGYGFENRYLSFHWLLQMAAGSGYALAPTLVAVSVLASAAPARMTRAVIASIALVGLGALFRVHVALLALGMICWLLLLSWRPRLTARSAVWGLGAAAVVGGVLAWSESVSLAPHFLTGSSHPVVFFRALHTQSVTTTSPFTEWSEHLGDAGKVALGFAMMLVAGCGASLGVLVLTGLSGVWRRLGRRVTALVLALLLSSLSVILFVPTPAHGDVTDLGHRPFVLVYLVVALVAGASAVKLLAEWSERRFSSHRPVTLLMACLMLAGLVVPWHYGAKIQQRWMPKYSLILVSPDLIAAGAYVRSHSAAGEQVLAASQDAQGIVVALTERAAYLSRMPLFQLLGGDALELANVRSAAHAALSNPTSFDALHAFGIRTGVAWYIADTPSTLLWPSDVTGHSVFESGAVRVYDLRGPSPAAAPDRVPGE